MAEVGPYGITQFDAPGVMASYQAMQGNRLKMMMEQKQLEMMERQANIQTGTMQALQAYASRVSGGGQTAPTASPASSGASPSLNAPSAPGGAPADPLAPLPAGGASPAATTAPASSLSQPSYIPSDDEMAGRRQVLTSLAVLNPEMGGQLADTFTKMDANQVAAVTQRHARIAQVAAGILQLPVNQRAAAIQQASPELMQMGLTQQQLAGFQPTDANLRQLVAEGMDIERVAAFSRPDVQSVRQGGALVGTNPDQTPTTLYESPTMVGPNGEVFQRPPALSTMPQARTATNPKTGQKIQFNPQTNRWEPIGGQSGSPTGTFRQ